MLFTEVAADGGQICTCTVLVKQQIPLVFYNIIKQWITTFNQPLYMRMYFWQANEQNCRWNLDCICTVQVYLLSRVWAVNSECQIMHWAGLYYSCKLNYLTLDHWIMQFQRLRSCIWYMSHYTIHYKYSKSTRQGEKKINQHDLAIFWGCF